MTRFEQTIEEELKHRDNHLLQMKLFPFRNKLKNDSLKIYLHNTIPILYASWEGFMKFCINNYIENMLELKNIQMYNRNLLGYIFNNIDKTKLTSVRTDFTKQCTYFENMFEIFSTSSLPFPKIEVGILWYKYLKQLLLQLNLYDSFAKYEKKINKLIEYRNDIAHGRNVIPVKEDKFFIYLGLVQTLNNLTFDTFIKGINERRYMRNNFSSPLIS